MGATNGWIVGKRFNECNYKMTYDVTFCEGEYFNANLIKIEKVVAQDESGALTKIYVKFWGTTIFVYSIKIITL